MMGTLGNNSPFCGKKLSITANGVSQDAVIADMCPGCVSFFQNHESIEVVANNMHNSLVNLSTSLPLFSQNSSTAQPPGDSMTLSGTLLAKRPYISGGSWVTSMRQNMVII